MNHHPNHPEDHLPEALQSDLASQFNTHFSIPPQLDRRILDLAKSNFARRHRIRLQLRWGGGAAAAAALLLVALHLHHPQPAPRFVSTQSAGTTRALPADINHDGVVDILDAMALARQLESKTAPTANLDINNDGKVDQRDVDAIATQAVSLHGATIQ